MHHLTQEEPIQSGYGRFYTNAYEHGVRVRLHPAKIQEARYITGEEGLFVRLAFENGSGIEECCDLEFPNDAKKIMRLFGPSKPEHLRWMNVERMTQHGHNVGFRTLDKRPLLNGK